MGVELHITRARHWAENEGDEIGSDEWLAYVQSDPELEQRPENGEYFVRWLGQSKYEEPWLEWSNGNISTKWPDTALYRKMLQVAQRLDAQVQDDDGNSYVSEEDWEFDPSKGSPTVKKTGPWWKKLFGV